MVIDGRDCIDMLEKLTLVLSWLREANLTLKPSKCSFRARSIEFLGFIVEGGEIRSGEEKTKAITEYSSPTVIHSMPRFVGLTGFFRRFVKDYATIAEPLTRLARKEAVYNWGELQEGSFRRLQSMLTSATVLTMYKIDATVTDASSTGLGALLLQAQDEGELLKLVYGASRKSSEAETRYHSSKLELLSIVLAVNKLRQFLLGILFTVITECKALVYLNTNKSLSSQVARWSDSLQEYDYSVRYRPGTRMTHADALSRAPVGQAIECDVEKDIAGRYEMCTIMSEQERVMMCQSADENVARLIK